MMKRHGWKHDCFEPLTMDDYLDGCDSHLFPSENHGDASFTGVWQSSPLFLVWLEHNWSKIVEAATATTPPTSVPFSILELGSGTGFLGIHLAYNLQQTLAGAACQESNPTHRYKVTLSDTPRSGAYFWTKANLEKALRGQEREQGDGDGGDEKKEAFDCGERRTLAGISSQNLCVIPFDWACQEQRRAVSTQMDDWDLVIGTDLIYSEEGCHYLVQAMASLLNESPPSPSPAAATAAAAAGRRRKRRILYGHTSGRIEGLDQKFESDLSGRGLRWTVLERIPLPSWSERFTTIYDIQL